MALPTPRQSRDWLAGAGRRQRAALEGEGERRGGRQRAALCGCGAAASGAGMRRRAVLPLSAQGAGPPGCLGAGCFVGRDGHHVPRPCYVRHGARVGAVWGRRCAHSFRPRRNMNARRVSAVRRGKRRVLVALPLTTVTGRALAVPKHKRAGVGSRCCGGWLERAAAVADGLCMVMMHPRRYGIRSVETPPIAAGATFKTSPNIL